MKKKVLSILLALLAIATTAQAQVVLNETNFPDANFRKALASKLEISEGDEITAEKIAATTSLDVSKWSYNPLYDERIADLTGIEYFVALTKLDCSGNRLTFLDLSKNSALTTLKCELNSLTSLDLSKNTELTDLACYNNKLISLDVSKNSKLAELYCWENQLISLNVTGCIELENLQCYDNQLASLDVSGCTALTVLYCEENQLTSLDVSQNTALTKLICYSNKLTTLDVSKNTALTNLSCGGNQLTSLDVSNNTALTTLSCGENQLTSLDVSNNTALTTLSCGENQLTSLDMSKNTKLTTLWCWVNQLTSLDVSQNTALTTLECRNNKLTSLDVSKNTALTGLRCHNNQLASLDVSNNTALTNLSCYNNQLTSLDVSQNTALKTLWCYSNQIKGEAMNALVASLPTVSKGDFYVIDTTDENEGNVCTKSQVAVAKEKGWKVYDYNGGSMQEYEGSEDPEQEIDPVDEDDNIDYGNDMDENSDLDGNVIGNIYYNVGNGNGEYNADEGCVVIKKTTDDGAVNDLEGKDIFGDDFKGTFTGIVFKVPAGKGTVKVTAETTGNMLLKVKIGSDEPVEMELEGKLKISFPYNVMEETFVYIYAGAAANEAKGFGKTSSTDAALKIYGIEFLRDDATSIENNNRETITNNDWYSIDGKKLNGEPKKKGVYIRNGKKVVR